jgi:hypothetical protein
MMIFCKFGGAGFLDRKKQKKRLMPTTLSQNAYLKSKKKGSLAKKKAHAHKTQPECIFSTTLMQPKHSCQHAQVA